VVGLTQEELAERSGLSTRAIADMERGRTARPYRSSLRQLADALELPDHERERLERLARCSAASLLEVPAPGLGARAAGTARRTRPSAVVPRQLPSATPHFAGRAAEFTALTRVLMAAGAAPAVSAIVGAAGVGKTTLAVHWAHQVADQFPDGQLYVDLGGCGPSGDAIPPAEAIRGFLCAIGVRPALIPATTQAQTGLYRSLLAGRRVLIVLDNARDPGQVRPLLPGGAACLVLVTSRNQLTGLVAADGACPVFLDTLTHEESCELLALRLGAERLAREPQAAGELARLCAGLPLALSVVAARAVAAPAQTLEELAAELRVGSRLLDVMDTGEAATSLRSMLSCSYQELSDPARRMFRLLSVYPGPDLTAAAAASLADIPVEPARTLLHELAHCHLVTEHSPGRFAFHGILRAHAAERARAEDSEPERRAALHRVLDYLRIVTAVDLAAGPSASPAALEPTGDGAA
jgi:NB-ARC domain/Helix-turn-helix domain